MTLDTTEKQQKFTEQDKQQLCDRLEKQKKLFQDKQIDPDVYNLNRIAIQKTLRAVEAIMSGNHNDPKTGKPVEGIVNGKLERYFYIVAKGIPPPFMKKAEEVYEDRYKAIIIFLCVAAVYMICQTSFKLNIVCAIISFLYYDFFSGILHVNLDDPNNLKGWKATILFKPCLEFQWHHVIPSDIAQKAFWQSWGDLNFVAVLTFIVYMGVLGTYNSNLGMTLLGWKLAFAYFGQYCHRMSHTIESDRPQIVRILQKVGIMLSEKTHRGHHSGNHDDNFCIGNGLWNGVIRKMIQITSNSTIWFTLLGVTLLLDVVFFEKVISAFL